jgi:hypothetical protein
MVPDKEVVALREELVKAASSEAECKAHVEKLSHALSAAEKELEALREELLESKISEVSLKRQCEAKDSAAASVSAGNWLQRSCGSRAPKEKKGAPCAQDMCWQILMHMEGVTALLCKAEDFTINEASTEACRIWGSGALYGESVLNLLNGSARAPWLAKALRANSPSSGKKQSRFQSQRPGLGRVCKGWNCL